MGTRMFPLAVVGTTRTTTTSTTTATPHINMTTAKGCQIDGIIDKIRILCEQLFQDIPVMILVAVIGG